MTHVRRSIRILTDALLLASVAFSLSACGVGGSEFAGGGTGGTGISTGAVTGYGSVVVNDVHYKTNANTKKISNGKDNSAMIDQDLFRVGMVVTVRYSPGNNSAREIEYRDNLRGPIAEMASGSDNIITILGQSVVVDDGAIFASLKRGDVVEVSGFADSVGRIRATYILPTAPPMPPPAQEFEVKGFVSESSSSGFRLGPLPDGSGTTVGVSYPSGGPGNGAYVQVMTTDREPAGGVISTTRIAMLDARTDFPENVAVDLEGLVTAPPSGSGNVLSFAVEGKEVRTDDTTVFAGGRTADDIRRDARVRVRGTEAGGVLLAVDITIR
jgi:hypothetical protein